MKIRNYENTNVNNIATRSPAASQFCVVYGYMPAKATLFNKKCEAVFDFGTGPRNLALFNPQVRFIHNGQLKLVA